MSPLYLDDDGNHGDRMLGYALLYMGVVLAAGFMVVAFVVLR